MDPDEEERDEFLAIEGTELSDSEARELEIALSANPNDRESRIKLLGHLETLQFQDPAAARRRVDHILWFIRHEPGCAFVGSPFCHVHDIDPSFEVVAKAWEAQMAQRDATADAILAAAKFFALPAPERSRELLERGERLEPGNPVWADELGHGLLRTVAVARRMDERRCAPNLTPEALRSLAANALVHFERALMLTSPAPDHRMSACVSCAQAALEAGRTEEAVRRAREVLALAPQCRDEPHGPDMVHEAHIVLGRAAIEAYGNEEEACSQLDHAGRQGILGGAVLRSFGPDFVLANMLLARERKNEVLAYLKLCERFWNPKRVRRWRQQIGRGELPWLFTGYDPDEAK